MSKPPPDAQLTDVELICPDDWIRHGTKCYLPLNIHQSWPFALTTCQRYGSTLAKIQTASENQFIASLLSKPGKPSEVKEYWIGLTVEVTDDDELFVWADGTPTSRYVGFWRQDQPNFLNGSCALGKVDRKDLEWRLETCNLLRKFVCERPACVQGSYFCSSGSCISESKKCNGHNDCDDGSDEQNCPAAFQPACRTYERGENGQLSSPNYPNVYDPNLNCRHVIEGPANSRIEITIEHFDTEPDFDILTVLDGGPAENSTTGKFVLSELHESFPFTVIKRLSGSLDTIQTITTATNMAIVQFRTDAQMNSRGWQLKWRAGLLFIWIPQAKLSFSSSLQLWRSFCGSSLYPVIRLTRISEDVRKWSWVRMDCRNHSWSSGFSDCEFKNSSRVWRSVSSLTTFQWNLKIVLLCTMAPLQQPPSWRRKFLIFFMQPCLFL